MTWSREQKKRDWLDSEAGEFLRNSDVQSRTRNAITRHFINQYNPDSNIVYPWIILGQIWELEEIAKGELPIAGIGKVGQRDLQKVLDDNKST